MENITNIENVVLCKLPILHSSADCGSVSFDDGYEYVEIPLPESESKKLSKDKFVVWASGDSMYPEIEPGDLLIVDTGKNTNHNDLVIVSHCGDMLVKRLIVNNFSMYLRSNNLNYSDIKVDPDNTQIVGLVVWVCKKKV